jgi:glyoxylase-like metal-dependent hydrolase (beta-lactamase superfamily II)
MQFFVQGADVDEVRCVPCMAWLIENHRLKKKVLFDMGLRKDIDSYPPAISHRLRTIVKFEVLEDVFDSLEKLQIDPQSDVDSVIFSHLHYDHVGNPSRMGPQTSFILGPGASDLITGPESYPANLNSHYDSNMIAKDRILSLPPTGSKSWVPFGPFPETYDYFGDGSLRIVIAPGHCAGHINALLKLDSDHWVYLAGDTAHDSRILNGTAQTAVYWDNDISSFKCAHVDREAAALHLQRVQELKNYIDVEIILSHDGDWLNANRHRF